MVQLVRMWQLEETHVMPFQFHYGSISSKENSWYSREIENFNSTMVQLVLFREILPICLRCISIPLWFN